MAVITGTTAMDILAGTAYDDTIDGLAGADTMSGGLGNDIYYVDSTGDVITEYAGEGTDTIYSSIGFTLGANIENLTLLDAGGSINATGNTLNNVLNGNIYNNVLNGGTGADTMLGGLGNDIYYVDNAGDVAVENAGEGIDHAVTGLLSYTLAANIENLTVNTYNTSAVATGNELGNVMAVSDGYGPYLLSQGFRVSTVIYYAKADTLDGGAGADTMSAGYGNDIYYVDNAGDVITEGAGQGTDTVYASTDYTLGANVEDMYLTGAAISGTGNTRNNVLVGNGLDNTLAGGAGNDTYYVQNAGDIVIENAGEGADTVSSSVDYVLSANVENLTLTGAAISGAGNELGNALTGNAGNNVLNGGAGNDVLDGSAGADTMLGGLGNDIYYVDVAGDVAIENAGEGIDHAVTGLLSYTLSANIENLTVNTYNTSAVATGNELNNVLTVTDGYIAYLISQGESNYSLTMSSKGRTLDGGAGADTMSAGYGNDIYYVDNAGDVITEGAGQGTDTVYASTDYTLGANVEDMYLTGAAISGTGNTRNNVLVGNGLDNTLAGGAGNDTYYVQNAGDIVIENAGEGADTVSSSVDYVLSANVENLTLTGAAISGAGNELNNVLNGNSVVNTLSGGAGNDTYYVQNTGDFVSENFNEGIDTVQSTVNYTLSENVENLTLTGAAALNGAGNAFNNVLTGNAYNNVLDGGAGADTMHGGGGNDIFYVNDAGDVVIEAATTTHCGACGGCGTITGGIDTIYALISYSLVDTDGAGNLGGYVENLLLDGTDDINGTGNALNNAITGNSGNNILDGGAGSDTLAGGQGNDTYIVGTGDTVTEAANSGTDTVTSSIAYTLGANLENLTLTGTAAINGTGNALDNLITGNSAVNTLSGGLGNDTYVMDSTTDVIVENLNAGTDAVQSSVTYTLGANLENLTLTGAAAITGTGNALDNVITGNSAANTLAGGQGNDTYMIDSLDVADTVIEDLNAGTDTVYSSLQNYTLADNVENLFLLGGDVVDLDRYMINGTGNGSDNWLKGNGEENILDGGAGADLMEGGEDEDTYIVDNEGDVVFEAAYDLCNETGKGHVDSVFSSVSFGLTDHVENLTLTGNAEINAAGNELDNVLTGNAASNILTGGAGLDIFVFNTALGASNVDTIADFTCGSDSLQLAQAMFSGCALGELSATAFVSGAGVTSATTVDERIAYDTTTGMLYYDADGVGGADSVAFAALTATPALAASDIAVA